MDKGSTLPCSFRRGGSMNLAGESNMGYESLEAAQ